MRKISIIIPVMNEVFNIRPLVQEIFSLLENFYALEIILVCDPSSDGTDFEVDDLATRYKEVVVLRTATRAGQAECMRIGYEHSTGDCAITMDADFQDPPSMIPVFLEKWKEGNLIIHGRRSSRAVDGAIYRVVIGTGYRILALLTDNKVQNHVGDFRLIDKKIIPLFLSFGDVRPFWRGISNLEGIQSTVVDYPRGMRKSGATKYSARIGSPVFALRGLAHFSLKPLHWLQIIGVISAVLAVASLFVFGFFFLTNSSFPRGIPTLTVLFIVFFSIQFVSMAIIATYLAVVVEQTRKRPNYLLTTNQFKDQKK